MLETLSAPESMETTAERDESEREAKNGGRFEGNGF